MPKIIKNSAIADDSWILVSDTEITAVSDLPTGDLILPLAVWQTLNSELTDRINNNSIGVWLNSDEAPEPIGDVCQQLPIIAINFPVFADGRGYSYAQLLRSQYGYEGELRAIGDVLLDQLFYMKRSGFSSFAMREDQKLDEAISHLNDFNEMYQAAIDNPKPLFQRR